MGLYLNIGNQNFAEFSRTQYFVDKSQLINKLLKKDITEKFVCNSRARRFGKSVTADMLVAYFSKGADSRHLFAPLKCVKDALFLESMNAYDTIFVDIQAQFKEAEFENEEPNRYISRKIVRELQTEYADIELGEMSVMNALSAIYDKKGSRFVIIFDEWDYPIREFGEEDPHRRAYTELLRGLFKNNAAKSYIRLAYLTGIMPIVRTKGQSAVNNFMEYTMTNPMDLAQDIGFTEEEVFSLCERAGVDFEQMKEWYNGYDFNGTAMYNPLSVVRVVSTKRFQQYWSVTGTYGDIDDLISRNFDGLREDIIRMLSGNRVAVNVSNGKNDLQFFKNKSEVLTALISAFRYYHKPIREFPAGKGFADIAYLPRSYHPGRPVIVVELKWDKSAEAAVAQIRKKQYPESLREYSGEILLVGIDYDKKTKEHSCVIESVR